MLINGAPLNGATLNGTVARGPVAGPVVVDPQLVIVWDARVVLDGVDVSGYLIGELTVDLERGAAALADFALLFDEGPVDPAVYFGKPVQIHYRELRDSAWLEWQLYSGWVTLPSLDDAEPLISFECSDRWQDAIEALSVEQINVLCAGSWSADVFEPVAGRSRFDYAMERMSTRAASLQRNVSGALEVTPWAATPPAFEYGEGVTLDRTRRWQPVELSDRINVIELEADYRFPRLRERHQGFYWRHPNMAGDSIPQGFCLWAVDSTELPDIPMVEDATSGAGYQAILNNASWNRLPVTADNAGAQCDPQFGWINTYPDLLLGFSITAAMRWVQPVTEQYTLRIEATASVAAAGEVIERDRVVTDSSQDRERADKWESDPFAAPAEDATQDALGDYVVDLREPARHASATLCKVAAGQVVLLDAHRRNRMSVQVPTSDAMGLLLRHTVKLADQGVRCTAPVWALTHVLDFDGQTAITTITQAVSQGGGGVTDPLVMPPIPASTPAGAQPGTTVLNTQLAGRDLGFELDETLDGFRGNYSSTILPTIARDLVVDAPEIPADHRDEYLVAQAATYRVAIPDDPLEFY